MKKFFSSHLSSIFFYFLFFLFISYQFFSLQKIIQRESLAKKTFLNPSSHSLEKVFISLPVRNQEKCLELAIDFYPKDSFSQKAKSLLGKKREIELFASFASDNTLFSKFIYTVKKGESFYKIAEKNKVNLNFLQHLNKKENLLLNINEKLLIPSVAFTFYVDKKKKEFSIWSQEKFIQSFSFKVFNEYRVPQERKISLKKLIYQKKNRLSTIELKNGVQITSLLKKPYLKAGAFIFLEEKSWKKLSLLVIKDSIIYFI